MYERIFLSPPCRDQACLLCSILFFFLMLRFFMFEEGHVEHLQISLILHFSTSPILQLPFFVF